MTELSDLNARVIREFRENAGKVGGRFANSLMLLLHSTGARSGEERVSPVVYKDAGDSYVIFATYAGAPKHPAWYHNLVANPQVSIEVGTESVDVVARVLEGEERSAIWEPWKAAIPTFADYDRKTEREIPLIILEPRS